MKHKHYEMIVAKAANMDLVVLCKHETEGWLAVSDKDYMPQHQSNEYFLCLPQHKEACLHWLNGGQLNIDNGKGLGIGRYTLSIENNFPLCDFISHPEYTFIIEPKKEKRWIAVLPNGRVSGWHNKGKEMLKEQYNEKAGWQFIEIEVEV